MQIGRKFRDERRPKHGLLRCREFEMKGSLSNHLPDRLQHFFFAVIYICCFMILVQYNSFHHVAEKSVFGGTSELYSFPFLQSHRREDMLKISVEAVIEKDETDYCLPVASRLLVG